MIDGVFEWVLTIQLKHPLRLLVSDSTISRVSSSDEKDPYISSKSSRAIRFILAFPPDAREVRETRAMGTPSSPNHPARVNTTEANTKNSNQRRKENKILSLILQIFNIHA